MKQYFTIGRFQPFTIGHLSMIDENVSEYENISERAEINSFKTTNFNLLYEGD